LLDGLNGAASKNGARITASALSDYLYFQVPIEAQAANYTQKPDISHNTGSYNELYFS